MGSVVSQAALIYCRFECDFAVAKESLERLLNVKFHETKTAFGASYQFSTLGFHGAFYEETVEGA